MNNEEIEPVRSAVTAVAGAIINSFIVTHSIIITVIVTVSVLAVALSLGERVHRRLETVKDLETGFHDDALSSRLLDKGANRRRDVIRSIGGSGAVEPEETAGQAVPASGPDSQPAWRPS